MKPFEIGVLSPAATSGIELLLAAGRAGELVIFNLPLATDPGLAQNLARLRETLGSRFGIRVEASATDSLPTLLAEEKEPLELVLLCGEFEDGSQLRQVVASLRPHARRLFREVVSQSEAEQAVAAGADGVVAKGNESGGRVGSETTFVLLQRLCANPSVPVWALGGMGPNGAAACYAAGAAGIVLRDQLALAEESSLPDALRAQIAAMDGSETLCLGEALGAGFRVHRLRGAPTIRALAEFERGGASR
ncbi:MAG: nitronate monooxygenase, partial [Terriglobales bacterium]